MDGTVDPVRDPRLHRNTLVTWTSSQNSERCKDIETISLELIFADADQAEVKGVEVLQIHGVY